MTVINLLDKEFRIVFPTIIGEDRINIDTLLKLSYKDSEQELYNLKGKVNEIERTELLSLLELLDSDEFDLQVNYQLQEFVQKYPAILSFKLLIIIYQSNGYSENGFKDDKEVLEFYSFLEKYPDIIRLDDFFHRSRVHTPLLMLKIPSTEIINLLVKAVNTYPEKAEFKYLVGALYLLQKDYTNSNEYLLQYEGQIISDRTFDKETNQYIYKGDDVTLDQHILVMYSIMNNFYHLLDYENAIKYSDQLLNVNDNHRADYQFCFADPMTIRLRIFMKLGKREDFKKDFKILIEDLGEEDIPYMNLQDIVDYKNQLK